MPSLKDIRTRIASKKHAADHQGDEDGRRGAAAPRAGGHPGGAALRRRSCGEAIAEVALRAGAESAPAARPPDAGAHHAGAASPPTAACAAASTPTSSGAPSASSPNASRRRRQRARSASRSAARGARLLPRAASSRSRASTPAPIGRDRLAGRARDRRQIVSHESSTSRAPTRSTWSTTSSSRRCRSGLVVEQLLPVEPDWRAARRPWPPARVDFLYEPSKAKLLDALLPRYVESQIYRALLESIATEHGARMTAMDNATKNASEMIATLTLAVQPRPPGGDHQGADGDRLRGRGAQGLVSKSVERTQRVMSSE